MNDVKAFALDLAERAGMTFAQAFLGTFLAAQAGSTVNLDLSEVKSLAAAGSIAGLSAVFSLLKGVLGGLRTGTASVSKVAATRAAQAAADVEPAPATDAALAAAQVVSPMPEPASPAA